MNQKLHFTMALYHLGISVRDTLEYVQKRDKYDVNFYEAKKLTIENGLKDTNPFSIFCKNNGEIGEKVKQQLKDLYDLVYAQGSTFIRKEEDNLVVDHSLNARVLDLIIPLKVSLYNIIQIYFKDMSEEDKQKNCVDLVELENEFYSVVMGLVLQDYLFNDRFVKFNEEMKAHNGEPSVESNFTSSEISKLSGMYNYIKQQANNKYESFNRLDTVYRHGLELISGKVKPEEGKTIFEELKPITAAFITELRPIEEKYKADHSKVWNELHEYELEMQKASKN